MEQRVAGLEYGGATAANVAQTGSLLYRRLATCAALEFIRRQFYPRPADCQSATQQTDCLRYEDGLEPAARLFEP